MLDTLVVGTASLFICWLLSPCLAGSGIGRLCSCTAVMVCGFPGQPRHPRVTSSKRLPHISILGERGIAVLARLLFTFFPWCYNCIIKLSSQVQCRYCWWIVVACGSRDGKICCAVCSLGTLRQVITPPRLLPLIHKPYKDVVSEGGGKNFNVHSNIVTVGRES